jgi:hypothetical protein
MNVARAMGKNCGEEQQQQPAAEEARKMSGGLTHARPHKQKNEWRLVTAR